MPRSPRALAACLAFTFGLGAGAWMQPTLRWLGVSETALDLSPAAALASLFLGVAGGDAISVWAARRNADLARFGFVQLGLAFVCALATWRTGIAGAAGPWLFGLLGLGVGAAVRAIGGGSAALAGLAVGVALSGISMMFGVGANEARWLAIGVMSCSAAATWIAARNPTGAVAETDDQSLIRFVLAVVGGMAITAYLVLATRGLGPYTGGSLYAQAAFGSVALGACALGAAIAEHRRAPSFVFGLVAILLAAGVASVYGQLEWIVFGAARRLGGLASWPRALMLVTAETAVLVLPVTAALCAALGRDAFRGVGAISLGAAIALLTAPALVRPVTPAILGHEPFEERYGPLLLLSEDESPALIITDDPEQGRMLRRSDGRTLGGAGTDPEDRVVAQIPMLLHPEATKVLQLEFGVGNGASSILAHPVERLDVVDDTARPADTATFFDESNLDVLSDERLALHATSPWRFLAESAGTWDIIRLTTNDLENADGKDVPTLERLALAKSRLAPGGIVSLALNVGRATHAEVQAIVATMAAVFPFVTIWDGPLGFTWVINGSDVERYPSASTLSAFRDDPDVDAEIGSLGLDDLPTFLGHFVMGTDEVLEFTEGASPVTAADPYVQEIAARSPHTFFGLGGAAADSKLADLTAGEINENVDVARLFARLRETKSHKHSAAPYLQP